MPGHVWQSIYSKRLSRGQHRYDADANWGVLDEGAHWHNLANMTEQSMCSGNASLCQITLITCFILKRKKGIVFFSKFLAENATQKAP